MKTLCIIPRSLPRGAALLFVRRKSRAAYADLSYMRPNTLPRLKAHALNRSLYHMQCTHTLIYLNTRFKLAVVVSKH